MGGREKRVREGGRVGGQQCSPTSSRRCCLGPQLLLLCNLKVLTEPEVLSELLQCPRSYSLLCTVSLICFCATNILLFTVA